MAIKAQHKNRMVDLYESVMLSYAAGSLDSAQNLIVSTHIAMSKDAKNIIRTYEALGGALMIQDCEPVSMQADSLDSVLSNLENKSGESDGKSGAGNKTDVFADMDVPDILSETCEQMTKPLRWSKLYAGIQTCVVEIDCRRSTARLLKGKPSARIPHHTHRDIEIMLVLDGAYEDEMGRYQKGDLIVTDEHCAHAPVACESEGCVCLMVSSKPIRLTGLKRLLNPFVRI
jgi:putative transcriptional regulator